MAKVRVPLISSKFPRNQDIIFHMKLRVLIICGTLLTVAIIFSTLWLSQSTEDIKTFSQSSRSIASSVFSDSSSTVQCPTDLREYIQIHSDYIQESSTPFDNRLRDLRSLVYRCPPKPEDRPIVKACFDPIFRLLKGEDSGELGITLKTEWAPKPLVLPRALGSPDLLKTITKTNKDLTSPAKQLLRNLPPGSRAFQFTSAVTPEPLRSFVAVIPGDREDIFVHTHSNTGSQVLDHGYLVIRSIKSSSDGQPLERPIIEFFETSGQEPTVGKPQTNRCISCHRGGTIKILPQQGSIKSLTPGVSDQGIMDWFDQMRPKISELSMYDMSSLGPEIGPDDPSFRTDKFIRECATRVKPDINLNEISIIKKQMNCTGCHLIDGPGYQLLQYPMHAKNFGFRILDNIILSGYMPKTKNPTPENLRPALLSCLKAEFFGGFKSEELNQGNRNPGILMRALIPPACDLTKTPEIKGDHNATEY